MARPAARELELLRRLKLSDGRIMAPTQFDLDTISALVYFKYVTLPSMDGKNPMPNDDGKGFISVYAPLTEIGEAAISEAASREAQ